MRDDTIPVESAQGPEITGLDHLPEVPVDDEQGPKHAAKVTRKEVKAVLTELGINNKFTLRTVDFSDLARSSAQFVTIKNYAPGQGPEVYDKIKAHLKEIGVCGVHFER